MIHKYVNPHEFYDFNNHIVWYFTVFEVFKMGCNISVGQGKEFIRPDIVESQSQPIFFDSPFKWYDSKSLVINVLNSKHDIYNDYKHIEVRDKDL